MRPFWQAFWITCGIIGAVSLISTAGAWSNATDTDIGTLYGIWYIALLLWLATFVIAVIMMIARKTDIASGMLAGWSVGFLILATTCFANLATVN